MITARPTLWAVMVRAADGTMSLHETTALGIYWEHNTHIITWCSEETEEAARSTAAQFNLGAPRGNRAYAVPWDERFL